MEGKIGPVFFFSNTSYIWRFYQVHEVHYWLQCVSKGTLNLPDVFERFVPFGSQIFLTLLLVVLHKNIFVEIWINHKRNPWKPFMNSLLQYVPDHGSLSSLDLWYQSWASPLNFDKGLINFYILIRFLSKTKLIIVIYNNFILTLIGLKKKSFVVTFKWIFEAPQIMNLYQSILWIIMN